MSDAIAGLVASFCIHVVGPMIARGLYSEPRKTQDASGPITLRKEDNLSKKAGHQVCSI